MKDTGLKDRLGIQIKHGDYLIEHCDSDDYTGDSCCECMGECIDNTLYRCMYHPDEARFLLEELKNSETLEFRHLTGYHIGVDHSVTNGVLDAFQVIGNMETHDLLANHTGQLVELRTK